MPTLNRYGTIIFDASEACTLEAYDRAEKELRVATRSIKWGKLAGEYQMHLTYMTPEEQIGYQLVVARRHLPVHQHPEPRFIVSYCPQGWSNAVFCTNRSNPQKKGGYNWNGDKPALAAPVTYLNMVPDIFARFEPVLWMVGIGERVYQDGRVELGWDIRAKVDAVPEVIPGWDIRDRRVCRSLLINLKFRVPDVTATTWHLHGVIDDQGDEVVQLNHTPGERPTVDDIVPAIRRQAEKELVRVQRLYLYHQHWRQEGHTFEEIAKA